jgi:RNA polymerase sigma-70 factor (ECF subfamily)
MDDSQLVIACKKQDRNAQKILYERYAPMMMAVCLRYSGEEETARDLLHDGFIRAFTADRLVFGKGSFEGWLRRIS